MVRTRATVGFVVAFGLLVAPVPPVSLAAQDSAGQQTADRPIGIDLESPASRDYAFVQMMTLHDHVAINLARLIAGGGSDSELKRVAREILRDTLADVDELNGLRAQLRSPGEAAPQTDPMDDPVTTGITAQLQSLSGRDFDDWTVTALIAEQEDAVQVCLQKPPASAAFKSYADRCAERQGKQVKQLRVLKRGWKQRQRAPS